MSVGKRVRFEIFKRDSFTCQYCGKSAPDIILEVDHIEPVSKGGSDDLLNLITSCRDCNRGKSNIELDDNAVLEKRKKQLEELQARKEQIEMMMNWQRGLANLDLFSAENAAELWHELVPDYPVNDSGFQTLKRLIKTFGLPEVLESIRIAVSQYIQYDIFEDGESKINGESASNAFNKVSGILITRRRQKENPYTKDMYYIRGILKNRVNYVNDRIYYMLFKKAYDCGVHTDEIKGMSLDCGSWTDFRQNLELSIEESAKVENGQE